MYLYRKSLGSEAADIGTPLRPKVYTTYTPGSLQGIVLDFLKTSNEMLGKEDPDFMVN